jgi:hypothetical protein
MKKLFVVALLGACGAVSAQTQCFGTGAFRTCMDPQSGNTYNIQHFGGTTTMQGSNPNGSQWNQTSQSFGNMNITNGTDSHGRAWNETQTNMGNGSVFRSGTDASGRPFTQICNQLGCF